MFLRQPKAVLLVLAFAGAIGAFTVIAWLLHRDTVSARNFENIRIGMTIEEVANLLGTPPADSDMHHPYAGSYDPKEYHEAGAVVTRFWYNEEFTAQVGFDAHGLVVWKGAAMTPIRRWQADSLATRMRRWFGL